MPKELENDSINHLVVDIGQDTGEQMDREGYTFFPRPYGKIPHWFAQSLGLFAYRAHTNFEDMFVQQHPLLDGKCRLLDLDQRKLNRHIKFIRRFPNGLGYEHSFFT